ncbi:zinc finger protein 250 isoform X18 [Amyelois transitella]|uniref:zinc finger protein 250 isoform X18 n=1 Tax=Amyelois transitella TaxID=680683 RepID=UPI0029902EA2|nr:zinc finger protein 250 isoform X18 [Amyelois transitella]
MAAKSEWRPGPTVCRCCLTEGCYKDISTEYFWMGKREVYAEMLKDTLEVTIAYSKAGGPNSNSRLICESCISRLRDATEFKRQVVECERMFMQHLDPGSSSAAIEAETEPVGKIKVEGVKLEKSNSDDDFDNRHAFGDDDDDDDDDLDNQPLTKLASKMPTKESVDLLDLLDNSKTAEKRKSSTKVKPPPPKKAKSKVEQVKVKPSGSKLTPKPEKKKKEPIPNARTMARRNAQVLIEFTTAYPFKLPELKMVCVYCDESYDTSAIYRAHMESTHAECKINLAFAHLNGAYIKADCTELHCRICKAPFEKVETAAEHLLRVHGKPINLNYDCGIQPFNFSNEQMLCAMCQRKFKSLRALSRHTQSHYNKCTCEKCGKSYFSLSSLRFHIKINHSVGADHKLCIKCNRIFDSCEEKRAHLSVSPKCWRHICKICYERFMSGRLRNVHMKEVHGCDTEVKCPECNIVFSNRKKYSRHFKITHSDSYHACSYCELRFDSKSQLEKHTVTHTKEKLFSCDQCAKAFPRKSTLVAHMWIHSESKRFVCHICNKPFNQKVCWKTHMTSYHPGEDV